MAINETVPFNFDENYQFIKDKFVEKHGYDPEEGSNTMQLIAAMSYLTSMLNANTAVNINETILPLARKRNTVLRDARVLGYEIDHARSYQYNLDLLFSNTTSAVKNVFIKRHTSFSAGGKKYYYMGEEVEIIIQPNSDVTKTIPVTEGTLFKYNDVNPLPELSVNIDNVEVDGNQEVQSYVDIPFTDVEEDGIEVFLTYVDEFGNFKQLERWTKSSTFMIEKDTTLRNEFVRLDDITYRTPRIYFKIGDVGRNLRIGTLVNINVLKSSGADGEMKETPTPDSLDAEVVNFDLNLIGADEESIESIKKNAPLFHNTANRIITKPDYIAFCNRLAEVKKTQVWDGHDEIPKIPGHIWFSFLPSNTNRALSSTDNTNTTYELENPNLLSNWYLEQTVTGDIDDIFDYLGDFKVPTLVFNHRNPNYMDFEYDINIVKYNIAKSRAERNQDVFDVINEYFSGEDAQGNRTVEVPVESYSFEYFQSNLTKRIDTDLTDITGFNINLRTFIDLYKNNIITEKNNFKEIIFHLGYPYEDLIDENLVVNTNNMPSIDTNNFAGADNLYVDLSSGAADTSTDLVTYSIRLGVGVSGIPNSSDPIVGEYRIHTGVIRTIEVKLFITPSDYSVGIHEDVFDPFATVNVKYPSPNIRFSRNTIPRLRKVNFI